MNFLASPSYLQHPSPIVPAHVTFDLSLKRDITASEERLGITKAIKSIINKTSDSSDIIFEVELEDIDNIFSKELEINVFRIIQECMNNILKHSNASRSEIKIMKIDNSVMIIISDNGKGFSQMRNEGLGMKGINERVRLYKGSFTIDSVQGKGTIIHILLPIKK